MNPPAAERRDAGSSLTWYKHALELLHTHRGSPSEEVERVLADDPHCVVAHCLRAALIVRADDETARSTLAASVAEIEAARTANAVEWVDDRYVRALEASGYIDQVYSCGASNRAPGS